MARSAPAEESATQHTNQASWATLGCRVWVEVVNDIAIGSSDSGPKNDESPVLDWAFVASQTMHGFS